MIKIKLKIIFLGLFIFNFFVNGKIQFSQTNSSFVLSDTSSKVNIPTSSNLYGWSNASIANGSSEEAKDDYDYFTDDSGGNVHEEFIYEAKQALGSLAETGFLFYDNVATDTGIEQVAIGGASEIWGVKNNLLYIYDVNGYTQIPGQDFPWKLVTNGMYKISAGKDGSLWGIDSSGVSYKWNRLTLSWEVMPSPTSDFTRFWRIAIGHRDHVWAIGHDGSLNPKVYQWNGLRWNDQSKGSWYPNTLDEHLVQQSLSVGGDGLVFGIRSTDTTATGTGTDRSLVKWNPDLDTWEKIDLKAVDRLTSQVMTLTSNYLGNISVGEEGSIWANVNEPYLPQTIYDLYGTLYNANRMVILDDGVGGKEYILRPQKVTIDFLEAGYYGEVWMHDSIRDDWYRMVGGAIRSGENYFTELPDFRKFAEDFVFDYGASEVADYCKMRGITLDNDALIYIGIHVAVASPIDLNGGTMILQADLKLSSSSYFKSGGSISGHDKAIVFGGNVGIYPNAGLKFTSNTILDGRNGTLVFDNNAHLIVDSGVTVTLKNMKIKNIQTLTNPSFVMLAPDSQLVFKDVEIAMSGNYTFTQGTIFVYDDVTFTGTSKFIFESDRPLIINPHACLCFDLDTTFSFAPRNKNRNLIEMKDEVSSIYLNGSTFSAPADTNGVLLTKGKLIMNNNVNLINLDGGIPNSNLNTGSAITFGDGINSQNNLDAYVLSGALVDTLGFVDYNPA
ncbi:MAG: hypothetical protein ABIA74_02980 [bacterium]